jgi:tRNA modification GTPase
VPQSVAQQAYVSLLTPPGRGAVAVVGVCCPHAKQVVTPYFVPTTGKPLTLAKPGSIRFGRWQAGNGAGEEIVIVVKGPDSLEIHCHGGQAAVEQVLSCLESSTLPRKKWQELDLAAGWDHPSDAITAEALALLPYAQTEKTAAILLAQCRGCLSTEIKRLAAQPVADEQTLIQRIDALLSTASIGMRLTEPFQLVIAGVPNAGKSSLINALLGYGRAIVADQPGTTRDVLAADTVIDGWPVQVRDTAGLRISEDQIEAGGVELARRTIRSADLVLELVDATRPDDRAELDIPSNAMHLVIANKLDAAPPPDCAELGVSATTGENIATLVDLLGQNIAAGWKGFDAAVVFTQRQQNLLLELKSSAASGKFDMQIVEELHSAQPT